MPIGEIKKIVNNLSGLSIDEIEKIINDNQSELSVKVIKKIVHDLSIDEIHHIVNDPLTEFSIDEIEKIVHDPSLSSSLEPFITYDKDKKIFHINIGPIKQQRQPYSLSNLNPEQCQHIRNTIESVQHEMDEQNCQKDLGNSICKGFIRYLDNMQQRLQNDCPSGMCVCV